MPVRGNMLLRTPPIQVPCQIEGSRGTKILLADDQDGRGALDSVYLVDTWRHDHELFDHREPTPTENPRAWRAILKGSMSGRLLFRPGFDGLSLP